MSYIVCSVTCHFPNSSALLPFHSNAKINSLGKEQAAWICTFFTITRKLCLLLPFLQFLKKERLIGSSSTRYNRAVKLGKQCSFVRTVTVPYMLLLLLPSGLRNSLWDLSFILVSPIVMYVLGVGFFSAFGFQVQIYKHISVKICVFSYI